MELCAPLSASLVKLLCLNGFASENSFAVIAQLIGTLWQVEVEHFAVKIEEILKENDRLHIRIEQIQAVGPVGLTEW